MNETSLSFLYKNDRFYALCLPDLINAKSKPRINQFLREQRNLTELLKRIERSQLIRKGQLNEEKRQFSMFKRRKLPPIDSRLPSLEEKESRRTSTIDLSNGQKADTASPACISKTRLAGLVASIGTELNDNGGQVQEFQEAFLTVLPTESCQHGQTPKLQSQRREISARQSENICKNISYAAYNVK